MHMTRTSKQLLRYMFKSLKEDINKSISGIYKKSNEQWSVMKNIVQDWNRVYKNIHTEGKLPMKNLGTRRVSSEAGITSRIQEIE